MNTNEKGHKNPRNQVFKNAEKKIFSPLSTRRSPFNYWLLVSGFWLRASNEPRVTNTATDFKFVVGGWWLGQKQKTKNFSDTDSHGFQKGKITTNEHE